MSIAQLQRLAGNRAVASLVTRLSLQRRIDALDNAAREEQQIRIGEIVWQRGSEGWWKTADDGQHYHSDDGRVWVRNEKGQYVSEDGDMMWDSKSGEYRRWQPGKGWVPQATEGLQGAPKDSSRTVSGSSGQEKRPPPRPPRPGRSGGKQGTQSSGQAASSRKSNVNEADVSGSCTPVKTRTEELSVQHQADIASLVNVDLSQIARTWKLTAEGGQTPEAIAMEMAFAWSQAKHNGGGPEGGPRRDDHRWDWVVKPSLGTDYRVYLNTTETGTEKVSNYLENYLARHSRVGHKRGNASWAAERRDAIVLYIRHDQDLSAVLDVIGVCQSHPLYAPYFLDERVRLTRPAVVSLGRGGTRQLRGVGIADDPVGTTESFSQVGAAAVLSARQRHQLGTNRAADFSRILGEELRRRGRNPLDPSRGVYPFTVNGMEFVTSERRATPNCIMNLAGIDPQQCCLAKIVYKSMHGRPGRADLLPDNSELRLVEEPKFESRPRRV